MEKSRAVTEFTDEELDGLSDEEREGLTGTPADVEALRDLVDEDDTRDPEPESQTEEQAVQQWQQNIQTFVARVKRTEGIDYVGNKSLTAELDQAVKDLANAKDQDGNHVNAGKSGAWFLKEAHMQVKQGIGLEARQGGEAGDVHASDRDEPMGRADFDRLDDLDGLDLEDEVARMTPEDEERWLRAGS